MIKTWVKTQNMCCIIYSNFWNVTSLVFRSKIPNPVWRVKRSALRLRLTGSTAQPMSDWLDCFIRLFCWFCVLVAVSVAWFSWRYWLEQWLRHPYWIVWLEEMSLSEFVRLQNSLISSNQWYIGSVSKVPSQGYFSYFTQPENLFDHKKLSCNFEIRKSTI